MTDLVDFPLRPFVSPARILAGPRAVSRTGAELKEIGISPEDGSVLLVADAALMELGLTTDLLQSLEDEGFDVVQGPGIAAEPSPDVVRRLVAALDGSPVGAVIGVGGGSAIDASKLAAGAAVNALALTEGLAPTTTLRTVPPIVAVPSTAGTGAEATAVAMLWHESRKRIFVHPLLVPRIALLDPDLLAGLPRTVTAASGLDALSHAVESLLSSFRTPLTISAARSAVRRLSSSLAAEVDQTESATRQQMSLGAYEAGLALNASVVVGHSLAYTIASRTGLSHGVTCAMALPYCLAYCRQQSQSVLAQLGELVGAGPDGEAFLNWLVELTASLGIPSSLQEVGIETGALPAMAEECCTTYPRPNNPRPVTTDEVAELLNHFRAGDINAAWRAGAEVTA